MTGGQGGAAVPLSYRRLGALRFLLALLVLAWHCDVIAGSQAAWLGGSAYGPLAVLVFFAVSGFVITEAILGSYQGRPGAFLANRLLRLWPGWLAAVALMALVLWLTGAGQPWQLHPRVLLANGVALFPSVPLTDWLLGVPKGWPLLAIAWALRAEFCFYLAAAACILAGRWAGRRWLPPLLVAALLASLVGHHLVAIAPRLTFYLGTVPHFVLGAVAALWLNGLLSRRWVLLLAPAALLLATGHAWTFDPAAPGQLAWRQPTIEFRWIGVLLWLALLAWGWRRATGRGVARKQPLDRLLGDLTYNLYLFHLPVIALVAWVWPRGDWSNLLPAVALSLLVAVLFGWATEGALRRWRTRLRGHPLPGTSGTSRGEM